MVYLDYSATTPVNDKVLNSFNEVCKKYVGNPNSLHKLGIEAKNLINAATEQIADILNVKSSEIIYTSGASESNNTAIKGICLKYQNRGKHIITTAFEHSSVIAPLSYLSSIGYEVDFVQVLDNGLVDINHLKSLIRDDTILVSIGSVNSEIGIIQPIEEIGLLLKNYHKCFFHVDMTQSIGKHNISFNNIDLVSFSAHKFYGLKGIGCLVKKEKIIIDPLIHGGKSTTIFRSGTPSVALIVSLAKALRLVVYDLETKYNVVKNLNNYLKDKLTRLSGVYINSNSYCIPHILNISIPGIKPETFQHALEEYDIYLSTQTACSSGDNKSTAVYTLTKNDDLAKSSLRISISNLTTKEEIDYLIDKISVCYNQLKKK